MRVSVVVGVDGSRQGLAAAGLAAREASLRGRPLRVVHAFPWTYFHVPLGPSPEGPPEGGLRHEAERVVAEAVDRARATAPGIEVIGEVLDGFPAPILTACSRDAALLVVGDRGIGGFGGLLVGSVAVTLAAHAACPVLVARGRVDPTQPVLLAADGSPACDTAVGFAFEEASLRDVPLMALHTWSHPASASPGDMQPLVYDEALADAEETRVLAEALAGWHDKYPDVLVHRRVVHARTRRTIIDVTRHTQLVVVGARGRGGFAGLLLGSVSQAVLHHAACPTAIVRHPNDDD